MLYPCCIGSELCAPGASYVYQHTQSQLHLGLPCTKPEWRPVLEQAGDKLVCLSEAGKKLHDFRLPLKHRHQHSGRKCAAALQLLHSEMAKARCWEGMEAYPLQDQGGAGGPQLPLERDHQHGHQEAEQRSNEVERHRQPLVTRIQRIEAPEEDGHSTCHLARYELYSWAA